MRFHNWDVLIFPEGSKIPQQEFQTSCHVVQDPEAVQMSGTPALLPTVTTFCPSIPAGHPFRISIHCWINPEPSRYTQTLTKHPQNAVFEARLFMDGRHCGSKIFQRNGVWPMVIDTSLDVDRNGDFLPLKFPAFHHELTTQSFWNAADDLGRIKVVIAEGFPRDSATLPLERVKNVVVFSFQHAPLDVLESSAIAWPNPQMWRQAVNSAPYLSQMTSPRRNASVDIEAHAHSPRRRTAMTTLPAPNMGTMLPPTIVPSFPRTTHDPFVENQYTGGLDARWRRASTSDTSMPDYYSSSSSAPSRHVSNHTAMGAVPQRPHNMQSVGGYETLVEALVPGAPSNTPNANTAVQSPSHGLASQVQQTPTSSENQQAQAQQYQANYLPYQFQGSQYSGQGSLGRTGGTWRDTYKVAAGQYQAKVEPTDASNTYGSSSLSMTSGMSSGFTPVPSHTMSSSSLGIRSRKEHSNEDEHISPVQNEQRRYGENFNAPGINLSSSSTMGLSSSGAKRQRTATPASLKSQAIDVEDDLRSSPSVRSVRKVTALEGIENRAPSDSPRGEDD